MDWSARLLVVVASSAFLLAPMYSLTFIPEQKYQLIAVGLFVVLFAILIALASKASNQELFGATAAYVAVLVVFISQTPPGTS